LTGGGEFFLVGKSAALAAPAEAIAIAKATPSFLINYPPRGTNIAVGPHA
jgi:hypothetical protein